MTAERPAGAEPSLSALYRGVVCDLDGVVYRGHEAVPHAVEALEGLRAAGRGVVYATNNASRTPQEVAAQLTSARPHPHRRRRRHQLTGWGHAAGCAAADRGRGAGRGWAGCSRRAA